MLMTIIPFFIAGFFYSAWPWGFLIGGVAGVIPMITSPERYAHVWRDRKSIYVRSTAFAALLSAAMHGGSMLLANGIVWLIGLT